MDDARRATRERLLRRLRLLATFVLLSAVVMPAYTCAGYVAPSGEVVRSIPSNADASRYTPTRIEHYPLEDASIGSGETWMTVLLYAWPMLFAAFLRRTGRTFIVVRVAIVLCATASGWILMTLWSPGDLAYGTYVAVGADVVLAAIALIELVLGSDRFRTPRVAEPMQLPVAVLIALIGATSIARAQSDSSAAPDTTSAPPAAVTPPATAYNASALRIEAAWNGLYVVRGARGAPIANLGFFWPHDVTDSVRGDILAPGADSVAAYTRRALTLRQGGAFLTDLGGAVFVVTALHALVNGGVDRTDGGLAAIGASLLVISVPLHFAADNALSRAVWWHNIRLAR